MLSSSKANIHSMKKNVRLATYVCALFSTVLTGCGDRAKSPAEYSRDTAALTKVIPALEAQLVTRFRYQKGSKVLDYKRGLFAEGKGLNLRSSSPFDSTAKSDLESLWETIHATKTAIFSVEEVSYDSTGALTYAEFHFSNGFGRQRYVYHPGYTLPADLSYERWHTRIDDNWYHRRDDGN